MLTHQGVALFEKNYKGEGMWPCSTCGLVSGNISLGVGFWFQTSVPDQVLSVFSLISMDLDRKLSALEPGRPICHMLLTTMIIN